MQDFDVSQVRRKLLQTLINQTVGCKIELLQHQHFIRSWNINQTIIGHIQNFNRPHEIEKILRQTGQAIVLQKQLLNRQSTLYHRQILQLVIGQLDSLQKRHLVAK